MPITILDYVKSVVGDKDLYTAEDCLASGVDILGDGWSGAGFSATDISPVNPGEALLIAEGGIPQRIKAAYLSDTDIRALADYAAWTRRTQRLTPAGPAAAVA